MERHFAADVVGYSPFMVRHEAVAFVWLKVGREPKSERHHGRMFKLMGGGPPAEFISLVSPTRWSQTL